MQNKKYKLAIFDLDGTILNTLQDLADSTNYALEANGFPKRSVDEVKCFVGNGIERLIRLAVPKGASEEMIQKTLSDFAAYYKEHSADKTCPYDGIEQLIVSLRNEGVKTAVVSNKADFAVQDLCEKYFPELFDYVVGERQGIRRKPYPDSVFEVIDYLKVEKSDAVYIGDSEVDVKTVKNADMDGIFVTWGFRSKEVLENEGAKIIVDDMDSLLCEIRAKKRQNSAIN